VFGHDSGCFLSESAPQILGAHRVSLGHCSLRTELKSGATALDKLPSIAGRLGTKTRVLSKPPGD
jgi:hypothetical protein